MRAFILLGLAASSACAKFPLDYKHTWDETVTASFSNGVGEQSTLIYRVSRDTVTMMRLEFSPDRNDRMTVLLVKDDQGWALVGVFLGHGGLIPKPQLAFFPSRQLEGFGWGGTSKLESGDKDEEYFISVEGSEKDTSMIIGRTTCKARRVKVDLKKPGMDPVPLITMWLATEGGVLRYEDSRGPWVLSSNETWSKSLFD